MAEPKTKKTNASVSAFFAAVEDETRRKDAKAVDKLFREVTDERPAMWGTSIVGYGEYDGSTGRWMRTGFSPRKTSLVLYLSFGATEPEAVLEKLGKHKRGKGCLYINKLAEVDAQVLRTLIERAWAHMARKYP